MSFSIVEDKVKQQNRFNNLNLSTSDLTCNIITMKKINLIFPQTGKIIIGSNTINTSGNSISIGRGVGDGNNSINIGRGANAPSNANNSISIGYATGQNNNQGNSICIGHQASTFTAQQNSISIGAASSYLGSGESSISLGNGSGYSSYLNDKSISIGYQAGSGYTQGKFSIAIGYQAGYSSQSPYSIAIGYQAGFANQPTKTIILNSSGSSFSPSTANSFYVNPIRSQTGAGENLMSWDQSTMEVYSNTSKTFVIDHPLDNSKYLVHSCLEGPEAGVYYRGKSEIINGNSVEIILPEYVKSFSNFSVQISPIYDGFIKTYNTSEVSDGKFIVYGHNGKFNWMVHALRNQIDIEPIKSETEVVGQFPYRYITSRA